MFIFSQFFIALANLVDMMLGLLWMLVLIRALISWVNPDPYNPIVQFLYRTTEPILQPVRRLLPPMGIDISPIIVFFCIRFLQWFLVPVIYRIGLALR